MEQKFVTIETAKKVFANDDIKVMTDRNLPDLVRDETVVMRVP